MKIIPETTKESATMQHIPPSVGKLGGKKKPQGNAGVTDWQDHCQSPSG